MLDYIAFQLENNMYFFSFSRLLRAVFHVFSVFVVSRNLIAMLN